MVKTRWCVLADARSRNLVFTLKPEAVLCICTDIGILQEARAAFIGFGCKHCVVSITHFRSAFSSKLALYCGFLAMHWSEQGWYLNARFYLSTLSSLPIPVSWKPKAKQQTWLIAFSNIGSSVCLCICTVCVFSYKPHIDVWLPFSPRVFSLLRYPHPTTFFLYFA